VVIMDEPTAALGVKEGNMVLELIRRVRDRGLPVVLISHNMPHVFEVADRIHVARLGKRAAVLDPKKISMSDTVAVMTGAPPPVRGKVGQPSVPMALNPDGAFSIGVKIGRRSMDMMLVDFTGQVRERMSLDYAFPDPDTLFDEIGARLRQLRRALKPVLRERV